MNTTQLAQNIRARFNHHESKLYLKEKYRGRLTLISQEGTWAVSATFLASLRSAPTSMILLDMHERPVKVLTAELLSDAQRLYDSVMAEWVSELSELEKKR